MKKGLSVLLIAAALFGFYGGAVNLNDVLACKDYWEEAGEKSTADMNKLEDGLNQLKDNEKAYLDGLQQVADGEEALAQGEEDYAAGQAELAKGEADYAAAPGKLADARKQIAQGEKDLAAGEDKLAAGYADYAKGQDDLAAGQKTLDAGYEGRSNLDALIAGLKNAKTQFSDYSIDEKTGKKGPSWNTGFEKKATAADYSDAGLEQARGVITKTLNTEENQANVALIESIAKEATGKEGLLKAVNDADTYKQFDSALNDLSEAFGIAENTLKEFSGIAKQMKDREDLAALEAGAKDEKVKDMDLDTMTANYKALEEKNLDEQLEKTEAQLEQLKKAKEAGATVVPGTDTPIDAAIKQAEAGIDTLKEYIASRDGLKTLIGGREKLAGEIAGFQKAYADKLGLVAKLSPELAQALNQAMTTLGTNAGDTTNADYSAAITSLKGCLGQLAAALDAKVADITANKAKFDSWDEGYKKLAAGQAALSDANKGLPFAFKTMLTNSTIRPVLDKNAASLIPALQLYSTGKLASEDFDDFNADMKTITSVVIPNALKVLQGIRNEVNNQLTEGEKALAAGKAKLAQGAKDLAKGEKDLAAGKAKLADGKAQYAQGLKDFAAAPGKLEAGRAALAEGLQKLMDGRAELAAGKEKLGEYEDGEQQVRDGLATLMGTKPDGGLTSILDRRSGDDDFDNGDNHLELDEGLEAVEVGRGYQADSGVLITKEITNRAIGTAAGLGAGALAVLAAILSFLKKNKGAGISAILSAAAGGAGIAAGTSAGMEFSHIAGSAVTSTPWIAFGVLAAVALVHAIAHFASKEA